MSSYWVLVSAGVWLLGWIIGARISYEMNDDPSEGFMMSLWPFWLAIGLVYGAGWVVWQVSGAPVALFRFLRGGTRPEPELSAEEVDRILAEAHLLQPPPPIAPKDRPMDDIRKYIPAQQGDE